MKLAFLIVMSSSLSSLYLMIIPFLVHSFAPHSRTSSPIILFIIVDFPPFDGPINGIKITLYIFRYISLNKVHS